jgi:hypothetical protein
MSIALAPVLTRAGLAALISAQSTGLAATITHLAFGRGASAGADYVGYAPTREQTTLRSEIARVPILSGARLDPHGFRLLSVIDSSAPEATIREVAFVLASGQMLAIWSDPVAPLAMKTASADLEISLDLLLEQIPEGALAVTVMTPDIPDTTAMLARLLARAAGQATASMQINERLRAAGI